MGLELSLYRYYCRLAFGLTDVVGQVSRYFWFCWNYDIILSTQDVL